MLKKLITTSRHGSKKLIKSLEAARGIGTSMISLIIPHRDQISQVTKMLADEFGTASNIKRRVNRQSVLGAITSAQQKFTLYNKVPPNGLVLYTGTVVTDDAKEKKVTIDFEPFKPIKASLYLCDNKFRAEALNELLESDDKFGFIVMDGKGCLFGTLSGNTSEVLHQFKVHLPQKNRRRLHASILRHVLNCCSKHLMVGLHFALWLSRHQLSMIKISDYIYLLHSCCQCVDPYGPNPF